MSATNTGSTNPLNRIAFSLLLRVIDPAERYMRKQRNAELARIHAGEAMQLRAHDVQPEVGVTLLAARGEREWPNLAKTAAGELIATGAVTVTFNNGALNCRLIRFWRGDAILKTQFVNGEGYVRTRSMTRIRRASQEQDMMELRLLSLFEDIGDGT